LEGGGQQEKNGEDGEREAGAEAAHHLTQRGNLATQFGDDQSRLFAALDFSLPLGRRLSVDSTQHRVDVAGHRTEIGAWQGVRQVGGERQFALHVVAVELAWHRARRHFGHIP